MSQPAVRIRRRRAVRRLAAAFPTLFAAVAVACGGDQGTQGGAVTVADSAGLRVVTIAGDPRQLPALRVADSVPLRGAPEDAFSGNPQVAFPLRDGRLLLGDGRSVAVFSAAGAYTGSFSRLGQGPGEIGFLSNVWQIAGDSIWTFDGSNRRLSLFAPSLAFVRSTQQPSEGIGVGYSIWAGLQGDTTAVLAFATRESAPSATPQTARVAMGLWVIGSPAQVAGTERPFSQVMMLGGVEGAGVSMMSLPMGDNAQWRALGRCMAYGFSDRWEFTLQAARDSLHLRDAVIVRAPAAQADPVTTERKEQFIAGALASFGSSQARAQFERVYREQLPFPDSTPHFARVFTSRDGAMWVQRYRGSTTDVPDHWTVVDLHTPRAWRLAVPPGSRLLAVDSARALIATKDDDDLETQAWWLLPELAGIQPPAACVPH